MNILKTIIRPTRFGTFFVFLLVGFFSLLNAQIAVAAVCGLYEGPKCYVGNVQNEGTNLIPTFYHYWECKDNNNLVAKCRDNVVVCGNNKIEFGEECDGTALAGKTCKDYNGLDTPDCKMRCTTTCKFDSSQCTSEKCQASCGNRVVEGWEDCEANMPITKTCEEFNPRMHGNYLSCGADCYFTTKYCQQCGNNMLETYTKDGLVFKEVCDGDEFDLSLDENKDGEIDCTDFGFSGGKISCKASSDCAEVDTSQCNNSTCGNGKIDKYCSGNITLPCVNDVICSFSQAGRCISNEECDGFDLGTPSKTCTDLGCTGGVLRCFNNCLFDKRTCLGCTQGSCAKPVLSDWGQSTEEINKPCCGDANGKFFDNSDLLLNDYLCVGGGLKNLTREGIDSDDGRIFIKFGWTWECGDTKCRAFNYPECAPEIATANDTCVATKFHTSAQTVVDLQKIRYQYRKDKFCDIGVAEFTGPECLFTDWTKNNMAYICKNPMEGAGNKSVRCVYGWGGDGQCGSANDKTYKAGAGDNCAEDAQVKEFFSLIGKNDNPELCAPGSRPVYNRMKYAAGSVYGQAVPQSYPYLGIGSWSNYYKKWFDWQCQADDGKGRLGSIVDCQARLDTNLCKDRDAKCGPAMNGKFAYPGDGPQSGFCAFGLLTSEGVTVNRTRPAYWSWYCKAKGDGYSWYCTVPASVYCGAAEGGIFTTSNAVRTAGACGGPNGVLLGNAINSRGNNWEWTCEDSEDNTINTHCKAQNGNCGYADDKSFKEASFNSYKDRPSFLCPRGVTPSSPSLNFDVDFSNYKWNWKCGDNKCSTTLLECGWGNDKKYTNSEFITRRTYWPTFLCSNGNDAPRDFTISDDIDANGIAIPDGYDPGKYWWCEGNSTTSGGVTDKLEFGECHNHEYGCGYFNNLNISKSLFDSYRTLPEKADAFCAYGAKVVFSGSESRGSSWTCIHPDDKDLPFYETRRVDCRASHFQCGTAVDPLKAYYLKTLEDNLQPGVDTRGLLCSVATSRWPKSIKEDFEEKLTWVCSGSQELSQKYGIDSKLNSVTCSANKLTGGLLNGRSEISQAAYDDALNTDSYLCNISNSFSSPRYPILKKGSDGVCKATWDCIDSAKQKGAIYFATCPTCKCE